MCNNIEMRAGNGNLKEKNKERTYIFIACLCDFLNVYITYQHNKLLLSI